jgi:hypothetical protein
LLTLWRRIDWRLNHTSNARINNTSNSVDVVSSASGLATATIYAGTIAGAQTITASLVANPTQSVSFTFTAAVDPSSVVSAAQSTVSASKTTMQADGVETSTVTFTSKDTYGNTIPTGGKTIVLASTQGTLLATVTDNGNGTYTQTLRSPAGASSNSLTISATLNGAPVTDTETLSLTSGSYNVAQSSIAVSPSSMAVGSTGTALITVTLKDALGTPVTTGGQTVVLSVSGLTLVGSITDNGDGTYSQIVQNSTTAGAYTIAATINASLMPQTATLTLTPGTVSLAQSRIVATPSTLTPDGASTSTVLIVAKDQYGSTLTSSPGTATLTTSNGSWSNAISDLSNGTFSRTLVASASPGTATISGTINGQSLTSIYVYMSSTAGPSTAYSTVSTALSTIAADGTTTTTITVTLKSTSATQMSSGGSTVVISTTAGTLTGSVTDVGNGTYTQVLRSANAASIATVSATFDGRSITSTATVRMYGSLSLSRSQLTTSPTALAADGTSTALIILTALDSNDTPIPVGGAGTVVFTTTNGTLLSSAVDNGNGTYTQTIQAPGSIGSATISATVDAQAVSDTASMTFYSATGITSPLTINCSNILTYKNGQLVVNGTTVTLDTWGCPTDAIFTSVILKNNATLTHSATTSTTEYGLVFTADYVQVDAGSKIDVSARGYASQVLNYTRTQGNVNVAHSAIQGGTYGGAGGNYVTAYSVNKAYGNIFYPTELGSSGSDFFSSVSNFSGGGRVKITVNSPGQMVLNGQILAEGTSTTGGDGNSSSGSGGSIYVTADSLSGVGIISANGGGSASAVYSAGGGGRIATYINSYAGNFSYPTNYLTNVTACGGLTSGTALTMGHAGTVYTKTSSQTYGDLIINNCGRTQATTSGYTQIDRPTVADMTSVTATQVNDTGRFADSVSLTTSPYVGWYIDPKVNQNTTPTKYDNTKFKITAATPDTLTITSGDMTTVTGYSSTDQVEVMMVLDSLEVRGNAKLSGSTAHILVLSGDVSSNDSTTAVVNGMLSDGVEYRNANLSITFSGSLGTFDPRVEEWAGFSATSLNMTNFGTITTSGDIMLTSVSNVSLTAISGQNLTISGTSVNMRCVRGATNCITLTGNLLMTNTSTLTHSAAGSTTKYVVDINATGLTIDLGSTIDVSGRGFAYQTAGYGRSFGNTNVVTLAGSTAYYFGGSHGGRGGGATAGSTYVAPSYGSITNPYSSGGAGYGSGLTYSGGGIIKIKLNGGSLTNNGSINSKGTSTGGAHYSAGAGGSIWLDVGALSGTGTINADGGYGYNGSCGGGGGGRIAIYYSSASGNFSYPTNFVANITAKGGTMTAVTNVQSGAAGTIFAKSTSQTYGDLIVNGGNVNASYALTVINMPSTGTSTGLTATTLTNSAAFGEDIGQVGGTLYATDHLVGYYLNPNINQNGTSQWSDDTLYKITSHDKDTLTVSGNLTSVANSGQTYGLALVLDNLEIRGSARVQFNGKVIVQSGDVMSNDNTTFALTGYISGATNNLEFGSNVTSISIDAGSTTGMPTLTTLATNPSVSISNATLNLSNQTFPGSLSLNAVSFSSTGSTSISGNFSLTSSSATSLTGVSVGGNMTMTGSSISTGTTDLSRSLNITGDLTLDGSSYIVSNATTASTEYRIYIEANNITIPSGAYIKAQDKGYCIQSAGYFRAQGNQNVFNINNTTSTSGGGSHGGYGLCGTIDYNQTYGSFRYPTTLGSSGTYGSGNCGGGAIRVKANGTLSLDGTVSSNAFSTGTYGAGAGGSVWIDTQTLTGGGSITANGANGSGGCGGGGGRIAIYYTSLGGTIASSLFTKVTAYGGCYTTTCGAAGTIYMKKNTQTYGDLIVDNNAKTTTVDTFIRGGTTSTSSSLTSTSLTSASAFSDDYNVYNHLTDLLLDPRVTYGSQTLSDNLLLTVASNTQDAVTVSGGTVTSNGASNGDPYRLTMKLDNLEVRNSGRLNFTNGNIIVLEGDVATGDTSNMTVNGVIKTYIFDAGSAVVSGGTFTIGSYRCNSLGCY